MKSCFNMACMFLLCLAAWVSAAPASAKTSCNLGYDFFHYGGAPDAALVSHCLQAGADVNAQDQSGTTPLHHAASAGARPAVITTLVKAGANVNARDKGKHTPLHYAVLWGGGTPAVIATLARAGANVNARNGSGETPLHFAAGSGKNPAAVTALLAFGADPNIKDILGYTPMRRAARRADDSEKFAAAFSPEAVAAYREKERRDRAAVRKRNFEQRLRAARVSCEKWNTSGFFRNAGAPDVARCLQTESLGARNDVGETPLHMAAKFGKEPKVVAAIAKAGADLNARDEKGRTPLHTAAVFSKEPKVVAALIEAGADMSVRDKRGRTALEFAEKFSKNPAVVAVLRKFTVRKETKIAIRRRDVEQRPASAQVSCENWNTPSFFRDANLSDLLRCLKTKDANARGGNGRTPLHYAAQGEKPGLVTVLAGAGADVNARDERGGWTPLHLAAWFGNTPSVVDALLAVGADPKAKDKAGKTPWDYATQNAALKDTAPYRRLSEDRSR